MLPFFRKIRRKLANDNQFLKYSRYAIGEIVLVVVGILIALAINNWNLDRLAKLDENRFYEKLITDFNYETKTLNEALIDFKLCHDAYYQIFKETQGQGIYDSTGLVYNRLRAKLIYDLIVSNRYADIYSKISSERIRDLLNEKAKLEYRTIEAYKFFNEYKTNILIPYLSQHGVFDAKAAYRIEQYKHYPLYEEQLVQYDKLKTLYGEIEFDQILFELKSKTSWVIVNLERVAEKNSIILLELEKELSKQ